MPCYYAAHDENVSNVPCAVCAVRSAVVCRPAGVPGGASGATGVLEQHRRARRLRRSRLTAAPDHLAHRRRRSRGRCAKSQVTVHFILDFALLVWATVEVLFYLLSI